MRARLEQPDVRQEELKRRVDARLAVEDAEAVPDHGGEPAEFGPLPLADVRPLHLDEQRRLETELTLRPHLDAGLDEFAAALVGFLEVVLVAGAAADDQVQRAVQVKLRPAVIPDPFDGPPVLELERALGGELPPFRLRVGGAPLVDLL